MVKLAENLLQQEKGQVSRKFAAAKNGQVSRKFVAAKIDQGSRKFAEQNCLSPIVFVLAWL